MVEKPSFYRKFNDALVESSPVQVADLLVKALDSFGWSSEDKARLRQELQAPLSATSSSAS